MSNATKWLLIAFVIYFVGHFIWDHLGFNETRVEVNEKGAKYFIGPQAKQRNDQDEKVMDAEEAADQQSGDQ
ncbi:MAG: hypothetical protein C5B53_12440 [Candidatus Melainabacteria bacterium]|nr:MAG: hypothetical protein C5B53_12440 [Candidatus Melainabacteria bacterium]